MSGAATTRMSSKGQVVIPEAIRKKLGLESGDRFLVLDEGDAIILKRIDVPLMREVDGLIAEARRQAKTTGMRRSDVATAVARVRMRKQIHDHPHQ